MSLVFLSRAAGVQSLASTHFEGVARDTCTSGELKLLDESSLLLLQLLWPYW